MRKDRNTQLWFSSSNDEYYIIPTTVSLLDGELELFNYVGHRRSVAPAEAERYKVTKETAMTHIKDQLGTFFSDLSDKIGAYLMDVDWNGARDAIGEILNAKLTPTPNPTRDVDENKRGSSEKVFDFDKKSRNRTVH